VLDSGGVLDIVTGAAIQTAQRWEKHARLASRWLRMEFDSLTPDQRVAFSREAAKASSERDKAIASLGIKSLRDRSPWDAVDEPQNAPAANQAQWTEHADQLHQTSTSNGEQHV
jgi:hypothetical protein